MPAFLCLVSLETSEDFRSQPGYLGHRFNAITPAVLSRMGSRPMLPTGSCWCVSSSPRTPSMAMTSAGWTQPASTSAATLSIAAASTSASAARPCLRDETFLKHRNEQDCPPHQTTRASCNWARSSASASAIRVAHRCAGRDSGRVRVPRNSGDSIPV
jgi:hypothetical protein